MHKKTLAWIASAVFTLATGMAPVAAQNMTPPSVAFTQEELDQMLAPVALYPDSLLAQVLMAATYPLEVVQAARFVDSRPGLHGDGLARAIAPMPWDPSVKSLAQFPSVLTMMNDKLDWTQRLGNAFLSQQVNVMDTVQNLRRKAKIAGNLQSSHQLRVVQQGPMIAIEPVNPQIVYVPYYNPVLVYGNWWWPQRPPVYWSPPPRYRPPSYNGAIGVGLFFGSGIGLVRSIYNDARPDWHQHQILVNNVHINHVQVSNNFTNNATIHNQPVVWQHALRNNQNTRRVDHVPGPHALSSASTAPTPVTVTPAHPFTNTEQGALQRPAMPAQERHHINPPGERSNDQRSDRPTANLIMPNSVPTSSPAPMNNTKRMEPEHRPEPQPGYRAQPLPMPAARPERPEHAQQHSPRPVPEVHAPMPPQTAPHQEHHEPGHPTTAKPQQREEQGRHPDER